MAGLQHLNLVVPLQTKETCMNMILFEREVPLSNTIQSDQWSMMMREGTLTSSSNQN
jgi:hypothetical protein